MLFVHQYKHKFAYRFESSSLVECIFYSWILQVPKFKAQPLPDFHEVNLPERKVLLSTKPEPFRLRVDERGGAKTDRWDKMVGGLSI